MCRLCYIIYNYPIYIYYKKTVKSCVTNKKVRPTSLNKCIYSTAKYVLYFQHDS